MSGTLHFLLEPAPGFRSRTVALFVAQMDDQSRRRSQALQGITPTELEWQARPGVNTIGMLLAHTAIAETHWMEIGPLGRADSRMTEILGLSGDDDGMPLPPDGAPAESLRGRDLAYYEDLLARARAYTRKTAAGLSDEDLDWQVTRTRPDGTQRTYNLRWVFYHLLEHEAGHFGQALLLRHLYRTLSAAAKQGS